MTTATVTRDSADVVSRALCPFVDTYLLAKAYAQTQREAMDKIDLELIARLSPMDGRKPITNPRHLWRMGDAAYVEFQAARDDMIKAAGYNVERGYCPALMAEHVEISAARALVNEAGKFVPGMDADKLICSGLDNYYKAVDLLCKLVVNHPTYRAPKIK